jgi:hypothetical protein
MASDDLVCVAADASPANIRWWSRSAIASSVVFALIEVVFARAVLGHNDISILSASLLLVATIVFCFICRRPLRDWLSLYGWFSSVPSNRAAETTTGEDGTNCRPHHRTKKKCDHDADERRVGRVRRFSEQNGWGFIVCADQEGLKSQEQLRFSRAERDAAKLHIGDVVDFCPIYDTRKGGIAIDIHRVVDKVVVAKVLNDTSQMWNADDSGSESDEQVQSHSQNSSTEIAAALSGSPRIDSPPDCRPRRVQSSGQSVQSSGQVQHSQYEECSKIYDSNNDSPHNFIPQIEKQHHRQQQPSNHSRPSWCEYSQPEDGDLSLLPGQHSDTLSFSYSTEQVSQQDPAGPIGAQRHPHVAQEILPVQMTQQVETISNESVQDEVPPTPLAHQGQSCSKLPQCAAPSTSSHTEHGGAADSEAGWYLHNLCDSFDRSSASVSSETGANCHQLRPLAPLPSVKAKAHTSEVQAQQHQQTMSRDGPKLENNASSRYPLSSELHNQGWPPVTKLASSMSTVRPPLSRKDDRAVLKLSSCIEESQGMGKCKSPKLLPTIASQELPPFEADPVKIIIKNSFIQAVVAVDGDRKLQRSASDSDVASSSSSQDKADKSLYWLPSLSSSECSTQSKHSVKAAPVLGQWLPEKRAIFAEECDASSASNNLTVSGQGSVLGNQVRPDLHDPAAGLSLPWAEQRRTPLRPPKPATGQSLPWVPLKVACGPSAEVAAEAVCLRDDSTEEHSISNFMGHPPGPIIRDDAMPSTINTGVHKESAPQEHTSADAFGSDNALWLASLSSAEFVAQIHRETGVPIEELSELYSSGILQQVPRDEGVLTSIGSIDHASGNCRACVFWFRMSCVKSLNCPYCHLVHDGQRQKRIRPSKSTRQRRKAEASGG